MSDNLVTLTIDGKSVRVPRGTLVVEAARSVGITIPVFCYHHQMKPYGACRMCLVEVSPGPPLPQTACTSPVAEGMVVKTTSPPAVAAQKATVEFLLLNHPLDCPVCDRGGECPLQDNTFGYGGAESRYLEEKRHFVKPLALSDEVLLDRERCIMCYRCVRFCREIAGDESLTVIERGTESQIGLAPGRTFDSPFSGNTIEICPVGALTSSRYRFAARPWDIKSVATICPHCPVGCNIRGDVRNNEFKRFLSRENLGVDDGWLCDRGRFGYSFPSESDRIREPLVRRNGELQPATWAEAIDAVRTGLSAALGSGGGSAIAGLAGCQLTNEDLFYFKKLMADGLRSPNVDHTLLPHPTSPIGPDASSATIQGLDRSDVVVLVGGNPIVEHPVLDLRIKKAANRGAQLVLIGTEATDLRRYARDVVETADPAATINAILSLLPDELTAARAARQKAAEAGADRAFADAVKRAHDAAVARAKEANEPEPTAYASVDEGAQRYGLIRQSPPPQPEPRATGLEALLKSLGSVEVTDAVRAAARTIGGGERVTIIYPRERGADLTFLKAVTNLALLTDAVDRPGAGLMPLVRETNQQGAIDVGVMPGQGGLGGAELLRAVADGRIKALYVAGRELSTEVGGLDALGKLDFLVVQDFAMTQTAGRAHVVLPGLTFAEKDGSYTNLEGRVQRVRRALDVRGEGRPDWRIFRDVLNSLGGASFVASPDDVFEEIAAAVPRYAEMTFGKLGFKGLVAPYKVASYELVA